MAGLPSRSLYSRSPCYIEFFPVWQQAAGISMVRCFTMIEIQFCGVEINAQRRFCVSGKVLPTGGDTLTARLGLCWDPAHNREEENG